MIFQSKCYLELNLIYLTLFIVTITIYYYYIYHIIFINLLILKSMKKIFYLLTLFCFVVSCTNKEQTIENFISSFPKQETIKIHDIPFETEQIKVPMAMDYLNGCLYFLEYKTDHFIDVFDCSTGKLRKELIPKGNGPDEFLGITTMTASDGQIMIYDFQLNKIALIPDINHEKEEKIQTITLKRDSRVVTYFKSFPLSPGKFITSGFFKDDIHWLLSDSNGDIVSNFDTYPKDKKMENTSGPADIAYAYQGQFVSNPQKTKGLYTYNFGVILRFCDISKDGSITRTKEYIYEHPEYKPLSTEATYSVVYKKECISSFVDMKGTEKYCFLLYSGLRNSELKKDESWKWYTGNNLLIYDWKGNPIRQITLPYQCKAFAIDSEKRILYLLRDRLEDDADDDYAISILDLSDDFKSL